MGDKNQLRDEAGRFTRTMNEPRKPPHPCERLARTFNPPPTLTKRRYTDAGSIGSYARAPEGVSWPQQFDDAMALGVACVATGLPSDLLLARWAGRDHRGLACRLVFERMEHMGFATTRHAARVAVAWTVSQYLAPPPRSRAERPRTCKGHVVPAVSIREAAKQAHIRQTSFRLLARLTRAVLGDMLRELEYAYCDARFAGF
jgi:hypothetical protein